MENKRGHSDYENHLLPAEQSSKVERDNLKICYVLYRFQVTDFEAPIDFDHIFSKPTAISSFEQMISLCSPDRQMYARILTCDTYCNITAFRRWKDSSIFSAFLTRSCDSEYLSPSSLIQSFARTSHYGLESVVYFFCSREYLYPHTYYLTQGKPNSILMSSFRNFRRFHARIFNTKIYGNWKSGWSLKLHQPPPPQPPTKLTFRTELSSLKSFIQLRI